MTPPQVPDDSTILAGFLDWLQNVRGMAPNSGQHYQAVAKRLLRTVPRESWGALAATEPVITSYGLSQRAVVRSALRRLSEFLHDQYGATLAPPASLNRGGSRRVPPAEVVVSIAYLVDRIPQDLLIRMTWGDVRANGSLALPDGRGRIDPALHVQFALHSLSRWRPPFGPDSPLVPGGAGPKATPVTETTLGHWLAYRGEATADPTAARAIREAFADPETLSFPSYSAPRRQLEEPGSPPTDLLAAIPGMGSSRGLPPVNLPGFRADGTFDLGNGGGGEGDSGN